MLEIVLQVIAVIVTAVAWVPQTVKLVRTRDRSGVSLSSWALGAVTGFLFALYGLANHSYALLLSEGAFAVGACIVIGMLVGANRALLYATAGLVLGVLGVLWLPPVAFGVAGIVGVVGIRSLQVVTTLRSKTTAGMSSWSWILLTINTTAWGLYGLLAGLWPLVVTSIVGVATSLLLLAIVHWTKGNEANPAPAST